MIGSGDHLNIRSPMQWTDGTNAGFTTGTPWQPINGNYPQYNVRGRGAGLRDRCSSGTSG